MRNPQVVLVVLFVSMAVGCGGGDSNGPTGPPGSGSSGAPAQLVIAEVPTEVEIGSAFSLRVLVTDASGRAVTSSAEPVLLTLVSPEGDLSALESKPINSGVALFSDLRIHTWDRGFRLRASLGPLMTEHPVDVFLPFRQIDVGLLHACAMTDTFQTNDGSLSDGDGVLCWGDNASGQVGGAERRYDRPRGENAGMIAVGTGTHHTCGLTLDRDLFCWGGNTHGQLGNGTGLAASDSYLQSNGTFRSLTVGGLHTCAREASGNVLCWGSNARGQLGRGSPAVGRPGRLGTSQWAQVSAGGAHTCAAGLDASTGMWCFGEPGLLGASGEFGIAQVFGGESLSFVRAGDFSSCGVTATGEARCWGENDFGQLGNGTLDRSQRPVPVVMPSGRSFVQLDVGRGRACALDREGNAYCWGDNAAAPLGVGASADRIDRPTLVVGGLQFTDIAVGWKAVCAITAAGRAYCWGAADGPTGDAGRAEVPRPIN